MKADPPYDAIVIGGGLSGLIAAAYLAKAGKKTILFEAGNNFGGRGGQTLYALDPKVVKDLKLSRRGLRYAVRDMALTGLRGDGKHIVITRDIHATVASIAIHSKRDAETWPRYRRELYDLARAARSLWWEEDGVPPPGERGRILERISRMGASAWLDTWFESDTLKAILCFDATAGGLSILEPGSALVLVWRAAQEISGHQGAVAFPNGGFGALTEALVAAAQSAGAELRTGACVSRLLLDGNSIAGVQLSSGESCFASIVISGVSQQQTLFGFVKPPLAGIAQAAANANHVPSTSEARIILTLKSAPSLDGVTVPPNGRFILAERPETYIEAEFAAHKDQIADELPIELTIPTAADPSLAPSGQHIVSVLIRPLPRDPVAAALKPQLIARVINSLGRVLPDLASSVLQADLLTSDDAGLSVGRILAGSRQRIETSVHGLFLCGVDAEPVSAVSGRAARFAAALALGAER